MTDEEWAVVIVNLVYAVLFVGLMIPVAMAIRKVVCAMTIGCPPA